MNHDTFNLEHVHSLLSDRALQGMDAAEEAGLRCLLTQYPDLDTDSFDRAAATLDLALAAEDQEAMPLALFHRLQAQAASFTAPASVNPALVIPALAPIAPPRRRLGNTAPLTWIGWLVAAVIFLFAVLPGQQPKLSYAKLKERGALVVAAGKGPHGTEAMKGEFVWDSNTQQGYMKLAGLPVNNPKQSQYQLWIFDKTKPFTKDMPIDGGVFDISSDKEALIPIKANLKVDEPFLFAITIEPSGGVMQSKRDQLVVMGAVPQANP